MTVGRKGCLRKSFRVIRTAVVVEAKSSFRVPSGTGASRWGGRLARATCGRGLLRDEKRPPPTGYYQASSSLRVPLGTGLPPGVRPAMGRSRTSCAPYGRSCFRIVVFRFSGLCRASSSFRVPSGPTGAFAGFASQNAARNPARHALGAIQIFRTWRNRMNRQGARAKTGVPGN